MMINFADVVALGLDSKTDTELATILPTLTSGTLKNSAVRAWLRTEKLWYRTGPQAMGGEFQSVYASLPAALQGLLDEFYAAVFGGAAEELHTNEVTTAGEFATGLAGLKTASLLTDAQIDAFYNLDGGRPWKDVAEADITAARATHASQLAAQAAYDAVRSRHNAGQAAALAALDAGDTPAQIIAAAEAAEA